MNTINGHRLRKEKSLDALFSNEFEAKKFLNQVNKLHEEVTMNIVRGTMHHEHNFELYQNEIDDLDSILDQEKIQSLISSV